MTEDSIQGACEELVRLKVLELQRDIETQAELIIEMARVGFPNSRIAELIGTTPDTVRSAINKKAARAKRAKP